MEENLKTASVAHMFTHKLRIKLIFFLAQEIDFWNEIRICDFGNNEIAVTCTESMGKADFPSALTIKRNIWFVKQLKCR